MKEYKIVCDKYERHSKRFGGNEYTKTRVNPITSGTSFSGKIYNDLDEVLSALDVISKKAQAFDKDNNSRFTDDGSVIYREQTNFRIISREISEWKEGI